MSDNQGLYAAFIQFVKEHESSLNSGINKKSLSAIYNDLILPILELGKNVHSGSEEDKTKLIGGVFALAIYAKYHPIKSWKYSTDERMTDLPAFTVNANKKLVTYSPVLGGERGIDEYLTADSSGKFYKPEISNTLEKESEKLKDIPLTFLVHVITSDFIGDTIYSLSNVHLSSPDHKILFYHGDTEYKVSNND